MRFVQSLPAASLDLADSSNRQPRIASSKSHKRDSWCSIPISEALISSNSSSRLRASVLSSFHHTNRSRIFIGQDESPEHSSLCNFWLTGSKAPALITAMIDSVELMIKQQLYSYCTFFSNPFEKGYKRTTMSCGNGPCRYI